MPVARKTEISRMGPFLVLAFTVLVVYFARDLLVPFAFALMFAFLLAPAISRLEARGVPRVLAVGITGVLALTLLCGVAYVVTRQLLNVAQDLPTYRLSIQKKVAQVHSPAEQTLANAFSAVEDISGDLASGAGNGLPGTLEAPVKPQPVRVIDPDRSPLQSAAEVLVRFLRPVGAVLVVIVFTFYFLLEREDVRRRVLVLAGMSRIRIMNQALQDAATRISQYILLQVTVNVVYGALFGGGLFLLGVPNATLWGTLAAILRIVPYVGTTTALLLPLIVSVAISPSWIPPLLLIGLFLILELTATNVVEPLLFRSRTGISSLALLAMAIFWALLWGWPGLILSTPLTVCIVVLGRYMPQMSFLHTLLGADAELSAAALYYERLLAMDQQQTRAVARRFLQSRPLVEFYDSVLISTLALIEQDRHQGAFDEERSNFFFLSMGELIAEHAEYAPTAGSAFEEPELAGRDDFAVVCFSASDQADELITHMLVQVLERANLPTLYLPSTVSDDILDSLANEPRTVLFISALPPFAFAPARALCQRVRTHLPANRIVIGLWQAGDDPDWQQDLGVERFGSGRPTMVVNSLAQALRQVMQWHQEGAGLSSLHLPRVSTHI
jgi:predicted PurR-regulated permease PerM